MSNWNLCCFSGLTICGADCILSAEWKTPNKIIARTGPAMGEGEIIPTTRSGGVGSCTILFKCYYLHIGNLVFLESLHFF